MARIRLSEVIQNISGSIGNHVYSCWKGLPLLKNKAVSISNPRSEAQAGARARFDEAAKRWYTTLTDAQRALWNEYGDSLGSASGQTGPNGNGGAGTKSLIKHGGGVMSGFNAYLLNNSLTYNASIHTHAQYVDDAPVGIDAPNAPTELQCSYCDQAGTDIGLLVWIAPVVAPVGSMIRLWCLSLDAGVHLQVVANIALGTSFAEIDLLHIALGKSAHISSLLGHYHIQLDCVSPTGQSSPPSNVCQFEAIPDPSGC